MALCLQSQHQTCSIAMRMLGRQHHGMQGLLLHYFIITRSAAHLLALFEGMPLVSCTDLGDPGGDGPFNSNSNKAVKLSPPLLVGDPGPSSPMV